MADKYIAVQGEDGTWGVQDEHGAILYEAMFCRMTAETIADLNNADRPPADWEETRDLLDKMGLPYG